jgi:dipeptidyl aminopeptidase/acylaminoacyl peptidase
MLVFGFWAARNWDRVPVAIAGDSFTDWERGMSLPWPGEGPAPTENGQAIFYSSPRSGRGDIYVWDRTTGNSRRLTTSDDFEGQPAVSPDGEWVAYQRQERDRGRWRIWIMKSNGSQQRPLTHPSRGNDSQPRFSPDGKSVRFMRATWAGGKGQTAEFLEIDLASGRESPTPSPAFDDFSVTDEGQRLDAGTVFNRRTSDWNVAVRDRKDKQARVVATKGSYPLLVKNETEVLYCGEYARGMWIVGIDGKNRRQIFADPDYILMEPRLHTDKTKVVVIIDRMNGRPIEMWEIDLTTEAAQRISPVD